MRRITVFHSKSHQAEPQRSVDDSEKDSATAHEIPTGAKESPMAGNISLADSFDTSTARSHMERAMVRSASTQPKAIANKPFVCLETVTRGELRCQSRICICRCHSVTRWQPLSWVSNVFGDLLVGYSGISMPMMSRVPCSESGCQRRETGRFTATYYLPSWAVISTRVVSLFATWNDVGSDMRFRFPNIIDASADIFVFAQKGNIQGIQHLFSQKLATINDISSIEGCSALHVGRYDRFPTRRHTVYTIC